MLDAKWYLFPLFSTAAEGDIEGDEGAGAVYSVARYYSVVCLPVFHFAKIVFFCPLFNCPIFGEGYNSTFFLIYKILSIFRDVLDIYACAYV